MPFGLSCAPAIFQKIIEQTIADVPGVACYLDDLIVTGKTEEDHMTNLQKIFIFHPQKGILEVVASRLQRWAITLSAYDYEIQYKPSAQHGNADALSRLLLEGNDEYECEKEAEIVCAVEEQQIENLPLRGKDIKEATEQDPVLSQVFNYTLHGWPSL